MRIPSGVTDQYIYFVAVDATDLKTRETGFSSFTVYRSRNGAAAAVMTTPTINETDATNMPGVYELLLDEDMTIGAGNDSEEMVFHITHAGMAPVTRTIELYRSKITAGNTLGVASDGDLLEVNTLTGHTVQTGDNYARLGAPAGASVSADIAAVEAQTDDIGAAGAGLTAVPWNASWDAEVQSEVDDALVAFFTSAAQLVDDIWDEVITGAAHNVNTSAAKYLREGAEAGAMLTGTAQSATGTTLVLASGAVTADNILDGERVSILEGTGAGQSRLITASVAATDTVTVAHAWATNPDSTSVYGIVGSEAMVRGVAGQTVSATGAVDFDDLAAILVDTGTTIPGVLGTPAGADLATDIAANQTDLNTIITDTNELQGDWTDGGRLDLILDAILAMLDDPRTEPGQGAPPVNPDAMTKLDYLYKFLRNKIEQTATTLSIYDDAGTTVDQKATISDDGTTYTRGEIGTGP